MMDVGIELLFDGSPGNSITEAGGFAKALEDMGFASLWLPDHVVVFEEYAPNYSYSPDGLPPYGPRQGWFDPLFGLAAMAATTSRVRLGTNILILPERNPVVLAKEVVALDHLSGGRIDLGVGLGWSPEEFAACGVPYENRGARCDDYIAAMTCLWRDEVATYKGEYVSFSGAVQLPKPVQSPRPPVIIGGQTPAALRRAARLGDGWSSWMLPSAAIAETLAGLDRECENIGRDPASLRRIHTIFYPGAEAFEQFLERSQKDGVGEVVVVPWVPDRDPFEVLGEIAGIAGRS
jgi:probable F420-dependent oxidoreductase